MVKTNKRMYIIRKQLNKKKQYNILEALELLKNFTKTKFIESIDVAINLGIDTRKSDQNVRGYTILPHGVGRNIRVAVFAQGDDAKSALSAGADVVGMNNLIEKIKNNKIDFDLVISSPEAMSLVSKVGQILGPKGLMPNIKYNTITYNINEAVKNAKSGQIRYRNDKNGIIHTTIGKINFDSKKLKENLKYLLISIKKNKPKKSKGIFFKKISLSSTMGPGISINLNDLSVLNI